MGKDRHKVNIVIDSDLWRKVKATAALDGKTVAEWVAEVLKEALKGE